MELRSILSLSIRCSAALKHKSEAFYPSSARYTYSAPEDLITSLTCFSGKDPQNESNDILFAGNHAATLLISTFRIVVFMPDVH